MLIDTHAHLNMGALADDVENVLARAHTKGVDKVVCVSADMATSRSARVLAEKYQEVEYAVGVHPTEVEDYDVDELEQLAKGACALGEMGLDFYHTGDHDEQAKKYRAQLKLAEKLGLPVVIHARGAEKETLEILLESKVRQAVFHCYTGSLDTAREIWENGFLISVTGIVTYPKSEGVREVVRAVPQGQLMLETDCPFLAPQGRRGEVCEPMDVAEIAAKVAEVRGVTASEVAEFTTKNAKKFFHFKK